MTNLPDPFMPPHFAEVPGVAAGTTAAEMDEAIQDVERQFETMVVKARTSIRNRAMAIHPELQPIGYKVLTLLVHMGPRQQVGLAEELHTDKAMMSRTVKQLAGLGLVEYSADPHDGRAKLITITEAARARFDSTVGNSRKLLHGRLSSWDLSEVQRFAELLARLNETSAAEEPKP